MDVKTLLETEIERQIGTLEDMDFGSDEHSKGVGDVTKLLGELNKMSQIENEQKAKEASLEVETELKQKQMSEEKTDHIIKNVLTGVSVVGGILLTIWGTKASFDFEKEGTITTIMGRGFIQKLLPKK
jgi:hypothetical protein